MSDRLNGIANRDFDLLVIGGGINGAGVARDAALRGLNVLLVDRRDFGSGTTAASTRLIHGGLRYLEHYEFGLVHESLRERETLLRIAPHLVNPLELLLPIYKGQKHGPTKIWLGMLLYDRLAFRRSLPAHRRLSARETLRVEPGLKPEGLRCSFLYPDCQVAYPERLTIENLLGAAEAGATCLNYMEVIGFEIQEGRVAGARLRDVDTGYETVAKCPMVVNAAGPWLDALVGLLGTDTTPLVGGTKGSHIVIDRSADGPRHGVYVATVSDQRQFFIIPWRSYYLIGTTDIRFRGDPDWVAADAEEIEYLIEETNRVFPGLGVKQEDIHFTTCGVRPLPVDNSETTGSVTRKHVIHDHARNDGIGGICSLIGGKITTYRRLAEEVVDFVGHGLGRKLPGCQTDRIVLPGAQQTGKPGKGTGLAPDLEDHLDALYGTRTADVAALMAADETLARPVCAHHPDVLAQVRLAVQDEWVRHLGDFMLRRTGMGLSACRGLDCAERVARVMGAELGWDGDRVEQEVGDYRRFLEERMGVPARTRHSR